MIIDSYKKKDYSPGSIVEVTMPADQPLDAIISMV